MVTIIVLFSLFVSNLGLNQIITLSVPVLVMVYPITIVLVTLVFLHRFFYGSHYVYRGAILLSGFISLFDGLSMYGFQVSFLSQWILKLPGASLGLAWIVPAFVGGFAGDHQLINSKTS
ncbi:branched-chain amino acid transport system II carrier protein [Anaerobacillus sp. HL2]|nr:branched-chain amino acid transport system II carrier protein [Anaerobacillus sp. HL2]